MWLRELKINGFQCFSFDSNFGLRLSNMSQTNLLIGPNSSGKSATIRFLNILKNSLHDPNTWRTNLDKETMFHNHDMKQTICAEIKIEFGQGDSIELKAEANNGMAVYSQARNARFLNGDQFQVKFTMGDAFTLDPYINAAKGYAPLSEYARLAQTLGESASNSTAFHDLARRCLLEFFRKTYFFDPVRALDRASGIQRAEDGSGLLQELFKQSTDARLSKTFDKFRDKLIKLLNELLIPSGLPGIISIEPKNADDTGRKTLLIKQSNSKGLPSDIFNVGTGISELLIFVASLLRNSDGGLFCLEEPECHLHPGLFRRLFVLAESFSACQFLISTHSSAAIESINANGKLFAYRTSESSGSYANAISAFTEKHQVLDSLGVRGADLIQANCSIWVEGPSDRVYLKLWLEAFSKSLGVSLTEGSDYAFIFYGGSTLSNFGYEDDQEADLLNILWVNRYSAILMDRDSDPASVQQYSSKAKMRIAEQAKIDPTHRLALLTEGWEIENDVPIEMLRSGIADYFKIAPHEISDLNVPLDKIYSEFIAKYLQTKGFPEEEKSTRKLEKKTALAAKIQKHWKDGGSIALPNYVKSIFELIERSRTLG